MGVQGLRVHLQPGRVRGDVLRGAGGGIPLPPVLGTEEEVREEGGGQGGHDARRRGRAHPPLLVRGVDRHDRVRYLGRAELVGGDGAYVWGGGGVDGFQFYGIFAFRGGGGIIPAMSSISAIMVDVNGQIAVVDTFD